MQTFLKETISLPCPWQRRFFFFSLFNVRRAYTMSQCKFKAIRKVKWLVGLQVKRKMVTRKQEAVRKPTPWFGWFWRWLGLQVRTAGFFPFCLILVVLEAETKTIELCTWCCQIALFSLTRPFPITYQKCSWLASVLSSLDVYKFSGNAIVGISACFLVLKVPQGIHRFGVEGFCCSIPVTEQYRGGIWQCRREDAAALGALHILKAVGALPV